MSEQHEHKRDWFDEPCGGWRCDCGAWLGRDVKDPAGSAPHRAGTAPLTQGDPPPDDICSCDDPSLNVSTSDDPSGPAPAELLTDLALPWRLDEQDQRDNGIYGYAVLDANGVCVADHCDLRRAQAIITAVAQLATFQQLQETYRAQTDAHASTRIELATQQAALRNLVEKWRNDRAHTYGSENADLYRGFDHGCQRCAGELARLLGAEPGDGQ